MSICMPTLLYMIIILMMTMFLVAAVDRSKFRTCESTGFCRVYRQKTIGPVFSEHVSRKKQL